MTILTPIIYWAGFRLLFEPINYLMGEWFFTPLGLFAVLGFDVVWIIIIRLWPLRNIHVKIVLTLLVLTLSASVLTCLVVLRSLGDMLW